MKALIDELRKRYEGELEETKRRRKESSKKDAMYWVGKQIGMEDALYWLYIVSEEAQG